MALALKKALDDAGLKALNPNLTMRLMSLYRRQWLSS